MVFALVNPIQAALKFQKLARLDPNGAAARLLRRARGLAGRRGAHAGRRGQATCCVGWQIRNRTAPGGWRFLGGPVDPRRVAAPALVFCGERDSDRAAAAGRRRSAGCCRGARLSAPRTGHVGMIVGSAARSQVWRPAAEFLAAHRG